MGTSSGTNYTRRTHIVRVSEAASATPGDPNPIATSYVDIEVLDAIAFRGPNNQEMVLNLAAQKPVPFIVDDTGDGNAKSPDGATATRRSHMKRITSKTDSTQFFDAEVIDAVAFRDANGTEWILDMPDDGSVEVFNTTDGTGDPQATRRTHSEKISSDLTQKDPTDFITVERCDNMAFRSINGAEMIISCPSNNDPNSSDPAAATFVTPPKYDPTNPDGPTPPANTDPNVYFAFPKDSGGILTGDVKVAMGPLWWIRNVSGVEILVLQLKNTTGAPIHINNANFAPGQDIHIIPQSPPISFIYAPDAKNTNVTLELNPFSDDMLKNCVFWGTPSEQKPGGSNPGDVAEANIALFFNVTLIKQKFNGNFSFDLQSDAVQTFPSSAGTKILFAWSTGGWAPLQIPTKDNYSLPSPAPNYRGLPIIECSGAGPIGISAAQWRSQFNQHGFDGFDTPIGNEFTSEAQLEAYVTTSNNFLFNQTFQPPPPSNPVSVSLGIQDPITGQEYTFTGLSSPAQIIPMTAQSITIPNSSTPPNNDGEIDITASLYVGAKKFPVGDDNLPSPAWTQKAKQVKTLTIPGSLPMPASTTVIAITKGKLTLNGE